MAEFNSAEKIISNTFSIEPTNVMTGDDRRERFLLYQLKMSIANAKKIDIIVSFLMESGVRMILKDLKIALHFLLNLFKGRKSGYSVKNFWGGYNTYDANGNLISRSYKNIFGGYNTYDRNGKKKNLQRVELL